MKPERKTFKSFIGQTLEYRESSQIPEAELREMVEKLREGDSTMIDPIIKGHYKLVTALVADGIRKKGKSQDIEGAAFLCLVETVHNCCPHTDADGKFQPSRLYDNNITYYITTSVEYAIKDEYGSDHIIRVPPRTIRDKIAKGEKFEDIVPNDPIEIGGDYAAEGQAMASRKARSSAMGVALPFLIPIAKPEFPSMEFNEALAKCVVGETEKAIVRLRKEAYTLEEIGPKVGYSTPRVAQMMATIEQRFNLYYP